MNELLRSQKNRVEQLAQWGASPANIAKELGIPVERLEKRFARELEAGDVKGKHAVLEKLYDLAASGSNLGATSFWIKARSGWRDTGPSVGDQRVVYSVLTVKTTCDCQKNSPASPPKNP